MQIFMLFKIFPWVCCVQDMVWPMGWEQSYLSIPLSYWEFLG